MHSYWRRNGPPLHIGVVALGRALGVDLIGNSDGASDGEGGDAPVSEPHASQSVEDIANRITSPVGGGDTMAASLEAIALMEIERGRS